MRLLILTDDRLGKAMAGPAIRAWEIASHLSEHLDVTLASTQRLEEIPTAGFALRTVSNERAVLELARAHDAILAGGLLFAQFPALLTMERYLVLDLYDPLLLEDLELLGANALGLFQYREHHHRMERQLRRADYLICASERQKDYWLGRLCALGRINPHLHALDPSFHRLIGCVPFGLPEGEPLAGKAALRQAFGIAPADCLFLWGGGIWDWLDPLTPIRAVAELSDSHPFIKLVFLAGRSPNPTTPAMEMAARAKDLARDLGVLDRSVFFYEDWVPYSERGSILCEADVGFIAHQEHIETRFSFRTRVLDCFWAGLPVISTEGDAMADLVERKGLGLCCRYESIADWKAAFIELSDEAFRAECSKRVSAVRAASRWEQSVQPLVEYLRAPYRTPPGLQIHPWMHAQPLSSLVKAVLAFREEGILGLRTRIRRVLARRHHA